MAGPSLEMPPRKKVDERLGSWKEIANYLSRDVTTVQRWEKREGMPVHRHLHDKRGSVYALVFIGSSTECLIESFYQRDVATHLQLIAVEKRAAVRSHGQPGKLRRIALQRLYLGSMFPGQSRVLNADWRTRLVEVVDAVPCQAPVSPISYAWVIEDLLLVAACHGNPPDARHVRFCEVEPLPVVRFCSDEPTQLRYLLRGTAMGRYLPYLPGAATVRPKVNPSAIARPTRHDVVKITVRQVAWHASLQTDGVNVGTALRTRIKSDLRSIGRP